MIDLQSSAPLHQILCIGAHCDDVEIGCGGLLATLAKRHPGLAITVAVFSGDLKRQRETRAALVGLIGGSGRLDVRTLEFRDGYFPADWAAIKDAVVSLKAQLTPDLVLVHAEHDLHQDHRVLAELVWQVFRDQLILGYEIPKYDADLLVPNAYCALERWAAEHKIAVLEQCFGSQRSKPWFNAGVFEGLMRLRGVECRAADGFAEAFHARKVRLKF